MNTLDAKGLPDWPGIFGSYPFMRELESCPQDPHWHAEGNVLIHTQMVCEALARLPGYEALPEAERRIVMMAAIFHDCAKPDVTVMNEGRWRAPGHSRKGVDKLRYHWWHHGGAPARSEREHILELMRYHAVPIHYLERPHPESGVIDMSQTVRNDLLALLAEADTRGRISTDPKSQEEAVSMAAMFAEVARENRCLTSPWLFPNDHARFDYFRRRDGNYHYLAHDDRTFTVAVLAGLPGAGKDSWLDEHWREKQVVSMDELRTEMEIDPADNQGEVAQAAFELAKTYLRKKEPFAWNATNVTLQMRRKLYDLITDYGAGVHLVWLDADRATLLRRNRERNQTQVPIKVIERLARKTDFPNGTEAHRFEICP